MTTLTREEAFAILRLTGWPQGTFTTNVGTTLPFPVLAVAIAGAESDLTVEAEGPPNRDGSVDRGWFQVNSVHGYAAVELTSDPTYTARAALQILLQQGVRAWAAYGVRNTAGEFPYVRRLPPVFGGPVVGTRTGSVREINKSVQARLNTIRDTGMTGRLVVDGAFGPKSTAALVEVTGSKVCTAEVWKGLGLT